MKRLTMTQDQIVLAQNVFANDKLVLPNSRSFCCQGKIIHPTIYIAGEIVSKSHEDNIEAVAYKTMALNFLLKELLVKTMTIAWKQDGSYRPFLLLNIEKNQKLSMCQQNLGRGKLDSNNSMSMKLQKIIRDLSGLKKYLAHIPMKQQQQEIRVSTSSR